MSTWEINSENIAQTLARELPQAKLLHTQNVSALQSDDALLFLSLPNGQKLERVDLENLLPHPRRTLATAKLSEADSFIDYVKRHRTDATVVWAEFDPQSFSLKFTAVFDEHALGTPGWRKHSAVYAPSMSAEWKTWLANNKQAKDQLEFAEFIERHELDITTQDGYPTSLQMLQMATEFEANSDKRIKSVVRLQGGGVRMDYVDDDNAETLAQMKVFEKFQIGIPVFWAGPGYRIDARLKYRHSKGVVNFWYELIRPDTHHEAAAKELIERVRTGIDGVPMLMGSCA
jgi:uncharacterized protein YfdQ (DUF2303 family)